MLPLCLLWLFSSSSSFPILGISRSLILSVGFNGELSLPSLLGDVDHDGVSELVFGQTDSLSSLDQGAIHILFLYNRSHSFQSFRQSQLPLHTPLQTGNLFGASVCGLGDLDKDGLLEIAVSCPFCDPSLLTGAGTSTSSSGVIFILFLKASSNNSLVFDPDKTRLITGFDTRTRSMKLGHRLSSAGDVNQDGVDDLLVSEHLADGGRFWLLLLKSDGSVLAVTRFSNVNRFWGLDPRSLGDLDQDGVLDIVAWSLSEIHFIFMQPDGRSAKRVQILNNQSYSSDGKSVFPGFGPGQGFQAVEQIGDINADGVLDLLVTINGASTLLYTLCLNSNGSAASAANVLATEQEWAAGGLRALGDLESTNVMELIGLQSSPSLLTLTSFTPLRKSSQAVCYSNAECTSDVCGVLTDLSDGEIASAAAGKCLSGWRNFNGNRGFALSGGGLGSQFAIDVVLRYNKSNYSSSNSDNYNSISNNSSNNGSLPVNNIECTFPILSRQHPTSGQLEFQLCILANNQIEFRLSPLAATTQQDLVLRADFPFRKFVHIQVVGDGRMKLLKIQGRVVQRNTFSAEWNGEGYALNLGQIDGKFLKAEVFSASLNGKDLLQEIFNPCTDNTCTYPGSCQTVRGAAVCVCPPGTFGNGSVCSNIDACRPDSCLYGVTCIDDLPFSDSYTCAPCPEGTVGDAKYLCVNDDFCAEEVNPCVYPETCVDLNGTEMGALCSCYAGETGDGLVNGTACADIDSCQPPPCPEGVVCIDLKAPLVGYACPGACNNGTVWNTVLQSCVNSNACLLQPCYPGVSCVDLPPPSNYALCGDCPTGKVGTGYGLNGCVDVNYCLPTSPCFQGNCVSLSSSEAAPLQAMGLPAYYCGVCPLGYEGDGVNCVDKNYCLPSNLCFDQASCIDRPAPQIGYDCGDCPLGTVGIYGRDCVDMNACTTQPPPCYSAVNCTDEPPPSLKAQCGPCPKGFQGNGSVCEDINECLATPYPCYQNTTLNVKVECINLLGTFACGPCPSSFSGNGTTCTPFANPCAKAACAGCVQVGLRSFRCSPCDRGYISSSAGCLQFDPCSEIPCFKSGNMSSTCTALSSVNETFQCGPCPEGYIENKTNGNICTNFNACNASSCFPGAQCYDMLPPRMGFACGSCPKGYVGDAAAFTCQNYNACLTHSCYENVTCVDLPPPSMSAQCGSCPSGRVGDGVRCENYDACLAGPTTCFPDAECIDDPPPSMGHRCGSCPVGYVGDGRTCAFLDACVSLPCPNGTKCRQHGEPLLSRSCTLCPMGFVENATGACVDFDACSEHPCKAGRVCHDLAPPSMGFHCSDCPFGTVADVTGTVCTDPNLCLPNPCPSPLLCVDLPGPTGYRCEPETQRPTAKRPTPSTQAGIMGEIHFPAFAWESWAKSPIVAESLFRNWMLPALSVASGNTSTYNATSVVVEVNATDGGSLSGVLVQFRVILLPFSPLMAANMTETLRRLVQDSGPVGFGRGRLLSLRSIESTPAPTSAHDPGVELWQWILLGVGGLLVLLCCIGWALRKRKQRQGELEMQYLRKLQKEREGHQFPIEGDDIYTEGEEPWA